MTERPHASLGAANVLAAVALSEGLKAPRGATRRTVVICPGSRSTALVAALAAREDFSLHVVLDERCAAFMALGLARAQGQAVVMVCTSGSAGAHALPACVEAFAAQIPLIIITANRPARLAGCGAPQTTRQDGFFGYHVRHQAVLPEPRVGGDPEEAREARAWRAQAQEALSYAERGTRGPVHLDVPMDEPLLPGPEAGTVLWAQRTVAAWPPQGVHGPHTRADDAARAKAVGEAVVMLRSMRRGVVICGPMLGRDAQASLRPLMVALAQQLGWPLLSDPASQLRYGPEQAVPYDLLLRGTDFVKKHQLDGFVRIGHVPTSKALQRWLSAAASGRGILIEPSGQRLDPDDTAGLRVADEEVAFVSALLTALKEREKTAAPTSAWRTSWESGAARVHQVLAKSAWWDGPLWDGAAIVAACAGLLTNTRLLVGSSLPIRDVDSFVHRLAKGVALVANRGVNGIDGTLSSAIGLALGAPEIPTVVMVGDLTCLHDIGALQAARQLSLRLLVVVVDNGGGQIFSQLPIADHQGVFERFFLTPQKADFEGLARATGAGYLACEHAATLTEQVDAWSRALPPGLTLLHARCTARGAGPRQPLLAAASSAADDQG